MTTARLVLITHPTRGARGFARKLVIERLAACVNLCPLGSVYRWRGRVESARETLLVVKTTAPLLTGLERFVAAAHPYECPEFVVLAPAHVSARYVAWLRAETSPKGTRRR